MRVWHVCAHKALVNNANGWKWSDTERGEREREGGVRRGRSCGKQNAEKLLNFARSTLNIPFYRKLGNTSNSQALIYLLLFHGGGGGVVER